MRGDGVVEDVDGDCPPKDGSVVGDDDDDGIAPPEGKSAPAQVPPRDGGASSRKPSRDFFRSKSLIY